jgi:hypothetical protein
MGTLGETSLMELDHSYLCLMVPPLFWLAVLLGLGEVLLVALDELVVNPWKEEEEDDLAAGLVRFAGPPSAVHV